MKDYSKELTSEQKTVKAFTDLLNEQIKKLTYENEYLKEQLRIGGVVKSFTAKEVVNELKDCETIDDAIRYFEDM